MFPLAHTVRWNCKTYQLRNSALPSFLLCITIPWCSFGIAQDIHAILVKLVETTRGLQSLRLDRATNTSFPICNSQDSPMGSRLPPLCQICSCCSSRHGTNAVSTSKLNLQRPGELQAPQSVAQQLTVTIVAATLATFGHCHTARSLRRDDLAAAGPRGFLHRSTNSFITDCAYSVPAGSVCVSLLCIASSFFVRIFCRYVQIIS